MPLADSTKPISAPERYLEPEEWTFRQRRHREILEPVIDPWLANRSRQIKDPLTDFLFEYYSYSPSRLMRWSPGINVRLIPGTGKLPDIDELSCTDGTCVLDPDKFPHHRLPGIRWTTELLKTTLARRPAFGCMGMHEWAMVYKAKNIRHKECPLRVSHDELVSFVESRPLVCTHFDAFRFFTPDARPKNRWALDRDTMLNHEQAGCLHTNMDLYKWAFKLDPWVPGELVRRSFLLALEARTIDMKASPYDLQSMGVEPIRIETEKGRREYVQEQQKVYRASLPVRRELVRIYEQLSGLFCGK